jgi:3-oxoacyl-[acyl-carrier-protein] synthase III
MKEAIKEGKLNEKSNVLIAAPGLGYSWAGAVLKFL